MSTVLTRLNAVAEYNAAPVFRIGVVDKPASQVLHRPATPFVRSSLVFVANGGTEIRIFSFDGELIRTLGRRGSGPGEFEGLSAIAPLDDQTIMALERGTRRIQILDSVGALVTSRSIPVALEPNTPAALLPSGLLVGFGDGWAASSNEVASAVIRRSVPLFALDGRRDSHPDTIALAPGFPWWVTGSSRRGQPLGPRPSVTGNAGLVAYTDGTSYEYSLIDVTTGEATTGKLEEAPPGVVGADLDAWLMELAAQSEALGLPARRYPDDWREVSPERLPGYWRLVLSPTGCLWARRFKRPGADRIIWDIIDPIARESVASLVVGADFEIAQVLPHLIVGVETDANAIVHVVGYAYDVRPDHERCGSDGR